MSVETDQLKTFAVVEMMGHRKVVGIIGESPLGPGSLIRVDVLAKDGEIERTEHVGVGSIYCLTEVTEDIAKAAAAAHSPTPSWAYGIVPNRSLTAGSFDEDITGNYDDDDEEDDGYLRSLQGLPND